MIAEQAAQAAIERPIASARRLRYDLTIQVGNSYYALKAGAMIEEPEFIANIRAADPGALIALADAPLLPPSKPGEARFLRPFFATSKSRYVQC